MSLKDSCDEGLVPSAAVAKVGWITNALTSGILWIPSLVDIGEELDYKSKLSHSFWAAMR
jgi:hypothetical protein